MSVLVAMGLGWAVLAGGFSAVALVRLLARRRPVAPTRVPVLLLRPMDAPTERELENLARTIDYAGPLEHVVLAPSRPRLPEGVHWLLSDPVTPNRKVGHVLHGLETLSTDGCVVLVVDADVAVTGALVEGLASPVATGAALSTAVPTPVGERVLADRAMAGLLRRTHHSFRALHVMSAGAKAVCGKALGLSPRAVDELRELADHIGEDLELSKRLHARGLDVALCEAPAEVPLAPGSWCVALARFTRWMQVLESHRPGLYPTVPLLFTPTWPLLVLCLGVGSTWLAAGVAGLLAVRTLLSWRLTVLSTPLSSGEGRMDGRWSTSVRHVALDWLLGEALLLAAFLSSLVRPPRVTWRGRTYALHSGGRMSPIWTELSGGRG
ncbi:glycosyltransferase family 2 protein [Vitiosangium sp. GDMCC 1.1324]|uniref:glycosyltransferase n=1 Tax=Vitiosangium sp. (strain GDMCC 1.1324) TaxID=2138576 RepID=UPI000D3A2DE5|nr:glycosyltransferase [Vitiosangium sp. GDMCC 1.1324]PTL81712.1 carotenoid biosynthesis protein [Vitiosangium sp. GDMCC 1.1324]